MINDDGVHRQQFSVNCPHCGRTHHGFELTFPIANDFGHWMVECDHCNNEFCVELKNPRESGGAMSSRIKTAVEEPFTGDRDLVATEMVRHNIDLNHNEQRFNYAGAPLYECEKSGTNLETLALAEVKKELSGIRSAYSAAQIQLIKGGPEHDTAVIRVCVPCPCGINHESIFYTRMHMDPRRGIEDESSVALANISGSNLVETLTGIVSKNEFMDLLEKLVARWNLVADHVVVVSPFVGYAQMPGPKKLSSWERVLTILDADRTFFLTRSATWSEYKKAMTEAGISIELLERFDLQNRFVGQKNSKQDFHAKFYAGMSSESSEVLSGSANLVSGPSLENIAFHQMSTPRFNERYLQKLNLKRPLPPVKPVTEQWVLIERNGGSWSSRSNSQPRSSLVGWSS